MLFKQLFAAAAAVCFVGATATAVQPMNFLLIAVDDLRPMFGASFDNPEVLTPNLDKFFMDGNGSAMQHSYVQIAVCGPSRASILTGRRPDTTQVGPKGGAIVNEWCWCQRSRCRKTELFMTVPTHFAQSGYVTAGAGKIYHPDACTRMHVPFSFGADFQHTVGDDYRAWNYEQPYGVEGMLVPPFDTVAEQNSEEQFGGVPGPQFPMWNHTIGPSWYASPVEDERQTDGQLAANAVQRLVNFSDAGIGKAGGKPFFLATGFHKPHSPYIVPSKYFDMYDLDTVSLPPNPKVPTGFLEENWHANGNAEIKAYTNEKVPFNSSVFGFNQPVDVQTQREIRRAYFAATSFMDAQAGKVLDALEQHGYKDNTVVALWSDHGYHLGDTNSWCKMTNFEKATRNTMMWRVPGQPLSSQGRVDRVIEMVDFFPTVIDLMGLPPIRKCDLIDQPPTVQCLQGDSYADLFMSAASPGTPKQYAFSQWPYPAVQSPGVDFMRMGYSVRSADGYRYTEYVPYSTVLYRGQWSPNSPTQAHADPELYDYNTDPNETTNQAGNPKYGDIQSRLRAALVAKYTVPPGAEL